MRANEGVHPWKLRSNLRLRTGTARVDAGRDAGRAVARYGQRLAEFSTLFVLLTYCYPYEPLLPTAQNVVTSVRDIPGTENVMAGRSIWAACDLVVAALAITRWRFMLAAFSRQRMLLGLLGYAALSTLWSIHPDDTLRRVFGLLFTTLAGACLADRYDVSRWLTQLGVVLTIIIAASLLYFAIAPDQARMPAESLYAGAWRGVYPQKNGFGFYMLLACITFGALVMGERRRTLWPMIGFGLAFALLLLSRSATPLMSGLATIPALVVGRQYLRRPRKFAVIAALAVASAALCVLIVVALALPTVMDFFGRDMTLTGRLDVWTLAWAAIQARFWVGYGYSAFWIYLPSERSPVLEVWYALGWIATEAHNGLLDLWLSVGLVGVVILAVLMASVIGRSLRTFSRTNPIAFTWTIGFFVVWLGESVSEEGLLEHNTITWLLFTAVAFSSQAYRLNARQSARVFASDGAERVIRSPKQSAV